MKFRAQYLAKGDFPTVSQCAKVSDAAAALCKWALAIDATADLPLPSNAQQAAPLVPTLESQMAQESARKDAELATTTSPEDKRAVEKVEMRKSATVELLATAMQELRNSEEAATKGKNGAHDQIPTIEEAFTALKALSRADCVTLSREKTSSCCAASLHGFYLRLSGRGARLGNVLTSTR